MSEDIPEINAKSFTSPGALMAALVTCKIAVPFWLRIGNSRHRITRENKAGIEKGLLIAIEMLFDYER